MPSREPSLRVRRTRLDAWRRGRQAICHRHARNNHDQPSCSWPLAKGTHAPKPHIEHVVSGFTDDAYTDIMRVVRNVALAVEKELAPERIYLLSLGAQGGNSHVHCHVAGLPPGVPYGEQQFHALMSQNGVLDVPPDEVAALAARLRGRLAS
ncbi:HIT family protein [Streptomyces gardneri]|uniref:HIT family protein n=1 Tax=Streptomyces gardneri TaxID=66892 RepID=UPI0036BDE9D3